MINLLHIAFYYECQHSADNEFAILPFSCSEAWHFAHANSVQIWYGRENFGPWTALCLWFKFQMVLVYCFQHQIASYYSYYPCKTATQCIMYKWALTCMCCCLLQFGTTNLAQMGCFRGCSCFIAQIAQALECWLLRKCMNISMKLLVFIRISGLLLAHGPHVPLVFIT